MSEIGVLAGDKIRAMLEDLKQRYDLVLVDSPPVLGISDGSIIAREVDYVIPRSSSTGDIPGKFHCGPSAPSRKFTEIVSAWS